MVQISAIGRGGLDHRAAPFVINRPIASNLDQIGLLITKRGRLPG